MYAVGTIKLTWIDPTNYETLESRLYPPSSLNKAIEDGAGLNKFMLFELVKRNGDNYKWKLLPYGQANDFVRSMKLRDSLVFKIGLGVLLGMSIFGMYTIYKINK